MTDRDIDQIIRRMAQTPLSRRGFLWSVAAASGALTLVTVGQTFSPLRRFVLFAQRRPDIGTQGLPVNQSAVDAHVVSSARAPQRNACEILAEPVSNA